jgi:hypothetical protein
MAATKPEMAHPTGKIDTMKCLATEIKSLTMEMKSLNHNLTTQMKSFVETFFARMGELGGRLLAFFLLAITLYCIGEVINMVILF